MCWLEGVEMNKHALISLICTTFTRCLPPLAGRILRTGVFATNCDCKFSKSIQSSIDYEWFFMDPMIFLYKKIIPLQQYLTILL